jgi:N-acetylglucosamine kinase-like BadF-type ATPase
LGDEGSGYAIGLAALHAIARAHDGRAPATALTTAILRHWQLATPPDLIARVYQPQLPRIEIAELARWVERTATEGDEVAVEILRRAGEDTAGLAQAVVKQLSLEEPIPCALAGGALLNSPLLRRFFQQAADRHLHLAPLALVPEPAQGALTLARHKADAVDMV